MGAWFANETELQKRDEIVAAKQKSTHNKEVAWKSRNRHFGAEKAHKVWRDRLPTLDKSQAAMAAKFTTAKRSTAAYEGKMRRLADSHEELHKAYTALTKAEQAVPGLIEKKEKMKEKAAKEKETKARAQALKAV